MVLACCVVATVAACGGGGGDDAEAAAAVAPALAASPSPSPPATTATCGLPRLSADALASVNAFRAAPRTCGSRGAFAAAPALVWNAALTQAAAAHSQDMAARNYFSHTSQDGRDFAQRVTAAGYAWSSVGENIAAQPGSVAAVMAGWQASDGHCANLMNPAFAHVGVACAAGGASNTHATYWTMDLAKPR